jgi:DNA-binding response OmpR family regulator
VTPRSSLVFDRQRIVVADEETDAVAFIIDTLRHDGHCVSHAADALSGTSDVALQDCHLLITGTRIDGVARIDLIQELRERLPALPVLYLANASWSRPEVEAHLPPGVAILREPFTAGELRAAVRPLLPQLRIGSILALSAKIPSAHPEV